MEEQRECDYYIHQNDQSSFFRDKISISNPVFLSGTKRKGALNPKNKDKAYKGPAVYDYRKPESKKSYHFNLNNDWCT